MHPIETESYRETARAIRIIRKDCIERRIRAIKTGEQVPNDILSHILERTSKKLVSVAYRMYMYVVSHAERWVTICTGTFSTQ